MALLSVSRTFPSALSYAGTYNKSQNLHVTLTKYNHQHRTGLITNLIRKALTLPAGNFFKNSADLLVSPNTKLGATFTSAPEYCAAINAL